AVAQQLVHVSAVLMNDRDDRGEELVEIRGRLTCRRLIREAREAADVDERDRQHRPFGLHAIVTHGASAGARSHSDTCAGCMASPTTARSSALSASSATSSRRRALNDSSVCCASYLRR